MNDNPTKATYDLMLAAWANIAVPYARNKVAPLISNNVGHNPGVDYYYRYAIGFGPRFFGIGVPGYDLNGDPVFVFGRYAPWGMDDTLILARDGRFRLGWQTSTTRANVQQVAKFLRRDYSSREYVWYATSPGTSEPRFVDDFRHRVPYINEKMLRKQFGGMPVNGVLRNDYMPGWFEVVENDDERSTMPWMIQPARNQCPPGIDMTSSVSYFNGDRKFDRSVMLQQTDRLKRLREKRFNSHENNWRKQNNLPPRRTKTLTMRDDKETLVDQAAVTAIMANFSVSSPARITTLREARQEATT